MYRRTQLILLWEDELHVGQPEARTYATLLSAQLPALLSLSYKQQEGGSKVVVVVVVVKIHWTVFGNPDQFIARTSVSVVDNIDIFVNLALWQSLQMVEKSTC